MPVTNATHDKKIWIGNSENCNNIVYHYISFVNFPILRHVFLFIGSFIKTVHFALKGSRKNKSIICDVLNISISAGALLGGKLCGVKTVGIVTDLPGLMAVKIDSRPSKLSKIIKYINDLLITSYDYYIPLTEQMCNIINPKNKPYCVIEGLVDINMKLTTHTLSRDNLRHIIYAGSIHEKYGVKTFIEAFMLVSGDDMRLDIYGPGEMEKDMPFYMNQDSRIVYHGIVPNNVVVEEQLTATLLVNPRPTVEEFTKYSFPSKNMEYMASGAAVLTTKLPGMPKEYYPHVYLVENETVDGIKDALIYILSLSQNDVVKKGEEAKQFVLTYKNNKAQACKVLELLKAHKIQ